MGRVNLLRTLLLLVGLGAWEAAAQLSPGFSFAAGSPSSVATEFWEMLWSGELARHGSVTAAEAILGLVVGSALGSLVGLLLWYSRVVAATVLPFVTVFASFPFFAVAPLLIIWFGTGFQMKFALAALATFFISINRAFHGATAVSGDYLAVVKGLGANRHQVFRFLIVPGSMEAVLSTLRLSVGLSLLGAFIGEFIAAEQGLGYVILRSSSLFDVPRSIAAAFAVGAIALGLDYAARLIEEQRLAIIRMVSVSSGTRSYAKDRGQV